MSNAVRKLKKTALNVHESCLKWEHHTCAGISKEEYEVISGDLSTNIMFFCSMCRPKVRLALKFFNDI